MFSHPPHPVPHLEHRCSSPAPGRSHRVREDTRGRRRTHFQPEEVRGGGWGAGRGEPGSGAPQAHQGPASPHRSHHPGFLSNQEPPNGLPRPSNAAWSQQGGPEGPGSGVYLGSREHLPLRGEARRRAGGAACGGNAPPQAPTQRRTQRRRPAPRTPPNACISDSKSQT